MIDITYYDFEFKFLIYIIQKLLISFISLFNKNYNLFACISLTKYSTLIISDIYF